MLTIFIKEMRQLRRDYIVPVVMIALQVVVGAFLLVRMWSEPFDISMFYFFLVSGNVLAITSASLIIGIMTGRWSRELKDDFLNPCRTTPLNPHSIVAGKFLATWCALLVPVAVMLILFAFRARNLPDNYWTYDLPMLILLLLSVSAFMLAGSSSRFNIEHSATNRLSVINTIAAVFFMSFVFLNLRRWHVEWIAAAHAVPIIIVLSFLFTVAGASPVHADRMLPVRIAVLLIALIMPWTAPIMDEPGWDYVIWLSAAAIFSVLSASQERRRQSRRVVAAIGRVPWVWRPFRWIVSTGAVPGLVFALLLLLAAFGAYRFSEMETSDAALVAWGCLWWFIVLFFFAALTLFIIEMVERFMHRSFDPSPIMTLLLLFGLPWYTAVWTTLPSADVGPWIVFGGFFAVSLLLLLPTVCGFVRSCRRNR